MSAEFFLTENYLRVFLSARYLVYITLLFLTAKLFINLNKSKSFQEHVHLKHCLLLEMQ